MHRTEMDDGDSALRARLASTDLDRHLALFYRSHEDRLATVSEFVVGGLHHGQRCLYIADQSTPREVRASLSAAGFDVDRYLDTGQLMIVEAAEVYSAETFDPETTVASFEAMVTEAVEDGYDGLRAAGENTWGFEATDSIEELIHFEVNFDDRCPDLPVTAMCQYDVEQFSDETLAQALQTHRQIIWDGDLIENPYYLPPESYAAGGPRASAADLLLDQMRDVTESRRQVERREQRLAVLNRVLRHNIRNEANALLGRVDLLREGNGDRADHLETIETVTQRLLDIAEQARHVDETLDRMPDAVEPTATVVHRALDRVETDRDVAVPFTDDLSGESYVDAGLEVALRELLAVVTDEADTLPTVQAADVPDSRVVAVTVTGPTPLLSPASESALRGDTERVLQHSLGLRIWVTRWAVESLDGAITVDAGPEETEVRLTVPTVTDRGRE